MKNSALLLLNGEIVEYDTNVEMDVAIEDVENSGESYFYAVISRIDDQIVT